MKCKKCNGTGMVGIGNGIRGIKKCDSCNGTGHVDEYKKAIIFDRWFLPPKELDEFCKSIGYENPDYANDFELMFDQRIVEFCESRLSKVWNEMVYKGVKIPGSEWDLLVLVRFVTLILQGHGGYDITM